MRAPANRGALQAVCVARGGGGGGGGSAQEEEDAQTTSDGHWGEVALCRQPRGHVQNQRQLHLILAHDGGEGEDLRCNPVTCCSFLSSGVTGASAVQSRQNGITVTPICRFLSAWSLATPAAAAAF